MIGTATAHKAGHGSYIVFGSRALSDTAIEYSGRVNSAAKHCRAGRAVELFVNGTHLATTITDRNGNWSVTGALPAGRIEVTAMVRRKVKRNKRHRHVCGADRVTKKAP